MLFSEPKIPQRLADHRARNRGQGFSALQRAENSSTWVADALVDDGDQSFSALQRAENSSTRRSPTPHASSGCFSALQRAENSSTTTARSVSDDASMFQCSSASRKFLNAVNSLLSTLAASVSVLFSEPKIPQPECARSERQPQTRFQCSSASRKFLNATVPRPRGGVFAGFSALQRAENSSTELLIGSHLPEPDVSVLFSEPKIPQRRVIT